MNNQELISKFLNTCNKKVKSVKIGSTPNGNYSISKGSNKGTIDDTNTFYLWYFPKEGKVTLLYRAHPHPYALNNESVVAATLDTLVETAKLHRDGKITLEKPQEAKYKKIDINVMD